VDCYNISLNGFLFYFIGKNVIVFLTKHCQLLQRFFLWVFFLPKLSLLVFFLILSWLRISFVIFFFFLLTEKLNHVAKTLYLSSQNTVNYYKSFCSVFKFWITNTTFFFIMKYLLHHTFNFYYGSSADSQL
jgi:hypothetical protein